MRPVFAMLTLNSSLTKKDKRVTKLNNPFLFLKHKFTNSIQLRNIDGSVLKLLLKPIDFICSVLYPT